MRKGLINIIIWLSVLVAFFVVPAEPAFASFGYKSSITVDHTKVPSTQSNFPILVSQTDNRFKTVGNGGHVQNANGYDIRPYTNANCTAGALTYQLDFFSATAGTVIMWVNIASLSSSSDSVIYLCYGDSGLSSDGSSTSTWDSNYKARWSLKDLNDYTSSPANLTAHGSPATLSSAKIDGGYNTFSSSNYLSTSSTPSKLNITSAAITVSLWVKWTTTANNKGLAGRWTSGHTWVLLIDFGTNDKLNFIIRDSGDTTNKAAVTSSTYNDGNWHYVVGSYDGAHVLIDVDGATERITGDAISTAVNSNTDDVQVGTYGTTNASGSVNLDEVRISNIARSQDWTKTEYNNQGNPGTFETLGTESAPSGGIIIFDTISRRRRR